ncbi:hypothetical protein diail_3720 [Diaporthe ilicicola]|nr:hypothetical protein diail_3720 [Diaporthe ilicicola]
MAVPRFKLKVAAAHVAPIYMNKELTTVRVINLIHDAGVQGIKLLAFPETFILGYPYFIEAYPPLSQVSALAQYAEQSVVCDDSDPCIRAIQDACREAGVTISLGVSERMGGGYTLFNSQIHIDSSGSIVGVHRKLHPTYAERYVWAQGDGSTLNEWPVAARGGQGSYNLGGLCCWENSLNGARQALIEQNQHVHVGEWPSLSTMRGFKGLADAQIEALMKAHALTAQVFVLTASSPVDDTCLDWMEKTLGKQDSVKKGGGWSAVIHPFCSYLSGPYTGEGDTLVLTELDLNELGQVKVWIDGNGHYKRPEVLEINVNRKQLWPPPGNAEKAGRSEGESNLG